MVFAPLLARSVPLSLRSIINQININPKIQNINGTQNSSQYILLKVVSGHINESKDGAKNYK